MRKNRTPWYKMDNASYLYSSLQKDEYSAIYRFSAYMSETVDPEALQRAIDKVIPRFPGFKSRIKRGIFWYYFEPNRAPGPFLKKDVAEPCQPVRFNEDNNWLVRFYYYGRRISIEVFHAISDGAGSLIFFRNLLAQYLRERGADIPCGDGILRLEEKSTAEEWEDAYSRYAGKRCKPFKIVGRAYQNIGTPEDFYKLNVTMGFMAVDEVKARAKELGVSLNDYLGAVLMFVLMEKQRGEKPLREKPVTLSVPVNLRSFFPTKTMRNFILVLQPSVDPSLGDYTFKEVAGAVHHYMRLNCDPQKLRAAFSRNVRFTDNKFLKLIPRPVKKPIMSLSYRLKGIKPFSANMTNPGVFSVPDEMRPYIEHMEVIQGQSAVTRPSLSFISYGNVLEVTFSGTMREADLERDFFRFLVRDGIAVHIESNRQRGISAEQVSACHTV